MEFVGKQDNIYLPIYRHSCTGTVLTQSISMRSDDRHCMHVMRACMQAAYLFF